VIKIGSKTSRAAKSFQTSSLARINGRNFWDDGLASVIGGEYNICVNDGSATRSEAGGMQISATRRRELLEQ
jgi:hypothetical protein